MNQGILHIKVLLKNKQKKEFYFNDKDIDGKFKELDKLLDNTIVEFEVYLLGVYLGTFKKDLAK